MPPKKKDMSFESQMARLEEIISRMEAGGLTLEESLKCFEEGAALEKNLEKMLEETKRRLTQLTCINGQQTEIPMEEIK